MSLSVNIETDGPEIIVQVGKTVREVAPPPQPAAPTDSPPEDPPDNDFELRPFAHEQFEARLTDKIGGTLEEIYKARQAEGFKPKFDPIDWNRKREELLDWLQEFREQGGQTKVVESEPASS